MCTNYVYRNQNVIENFKLKENLTVITPNKKGWRTQK